MTEIWNAWCLFWGIADAAIIVGLLAVAAWSSMPKRNGKRSKLNPTGQGRADCGAYSGPGCSTHNG